MNLAEYRNAAAYTFPIERGMHRGDGLWVSGQMPGSLSISLSLSQPTAPPQYLLSVGSSHSQPRSVYGPGSGSGSGFGDAERYNWHKLSHPKDPLALANPESGADWRGAEWGIGSNQCPTGASQSGQSGQSPGWCQGLEKDAWVEKEFAELYDAEKRDRLARLSHKELQAECARLEGALENASLRIERLTRDNAKLIEMLTRHGILVRGFLDHRAHTPEGPDATDSDITTPWPSLAHPPEHQLLGTEPAPGTPLEGHLDPSADTARSTGPDAQSGVGPVAVAARRERGPGGARWHSMDAEGRLQSGATFAPAGSFPTALTAEPIGDTLGYKEEAPLYTPDAFSL